eukprot:TRINITY_DN49549_c0_g1_i1.p1 TRINITY_DN49549_c0_g1~~TRINITY_DN49549_c0_g1_i1.p1  ORF type:complete len:389 (+),score=91.09 TRINITY_DN49549_c0_g1_i1:70-1236(+)
MTNYSTWESRANRLVEEADADDKKEEAAANKALGLEEGPKGPPTVKAEQQRKELDEHSQKRKEFVDWCNKREVCFTHENQEAPIELSGDDVKGKAVALKESKKVTYVFPEGAGVLKLSLDRCEDVVVRVKDRLVTSTIEICRCAELSLELDHPCGTLQVDECQRQVRVQFQERDHVGSIYHQNSPGLAVSCGGADSEFRAVGLEGQAQFCTKPSPPGAPEPLYTTAVRRGEGEFPVEVPYAEAVTGRAGESESQDGPSAEQRKEEAERKRLEGNDMFRANDFMQAAALYSSAIKLDPTMSSVWANRSQCWLKLGDHEKALDDAIRCTEVDPKNPKGWFRKGMSLHAMKRYPEAIPALLEAEKLEPSNKQIAEAIKMAQLMARRASSSS